MSQTCPSCAAEASGRFCPQCGVAIDAACRECQNPLPAGARFCNQCGATASAVPAAAAAAPARQPVLPWVVAGVAIVALAAVAIAPRLSPDRAPETAAAAMPGAAAAAQPAVPGAAPGGLDPASVDLESMTPRQRADALFNRVMSGMSGGDTTRIGFFTDMAIQAYGMVPERNADLHYHLGELYRVKGDVPAARAQADTILAADPQHLFGLFGAANAEQTRGNGAEARVFFQRFLDAYSAEVARNLPEYQEHQQGLPAMRGEAQKAVTGS